jgi:hypothetical protein
MTSEYIVADSGEREEFGTGAKRDTDTGKGNPHLISTHMLRRLAVHLQKGAAKYDAWNWAKGIPVTRCMDSAMRHWMSYMEGKRDEDHLAAIIFNVMAVIHFEETGRSDLFNEMPWALENNNAK